MYRSYDSWSVSRNLPTSFALMGMLIMFGAIALQSTTHNLMSLGLSSTMLIFGAFFIFVTMLKVRIAPYSSRTGYRLTEIVLSSIPESLLVTSTFYGLATISVHLMQTYSFIGIDVWTFLNIPVTLMGWLLFEGFIAFLSFIARAS